MLKESSNGKIIWRLDPAIFDPNARPDPVEQTWAPVREIHCPSMIVRGGASDVLNVETCEKMVAIMPGSRWVEVPDAGHMVMEDSPEAVIDAALDFLRKNGLV